jgi:hypothetical protein
MSHQPPNNQPWQSPPPPNTSYPPQQPPYQTGNLPPSSPQLQQQLSSGIPVWLLVLFFAIFLYSCGSAQQTTSTPTQPTNTSAAPTQPRLSPTKQVGITVTHGTPHLGGPISDFYGKYGRQITGTVQSGSAPNGSPEESVGWVTDSNNAYFLSVHYYTPSHVVDYIDYVGPSTWSKAQYRDYLISNFAPAGTAENTQANQDWVSQGGDPFNPIAYTSDIGKFFLHISDGNGSMNTV